MATNDQKITVPCPRCSIPVNLKIRVKGVALIPEVDEEGNPGIYVEFSPTANRHQCPEDEPVGELVRDHVYEAPRNDSGLCVHSDEVDHAGFVCLRPRSEHAH